MEKFDRYKIKVGKRTLIILAGIVWMFAGRKIFTIGYDEFIGVENRNNYLMLFSCVVFFIFYNFIFKKMVYKHTKRILSSNLEKHCIFSFFDIKGYVIMIFMITMGICIRKLQLINNLYLGIFYIGLGFSLLLAGVTFLIKATKLKCISF